MKNIAYALIALTIFGVGMMFGEYISEYDHAVKSSRTDYITPEDFGANAHDTLSDTKAFQMAFKFSKNRKTRIIKLDSGTYILNKP